MSRIIPIILILIVIAASIAGIWSIGQSIFGGGAPAPTEVVNRGAENLTKTESGSGVRMTVRGPIVGNEEHNSYTITVKPNYRNMTTYKGYNKKPIQRKELSNNKKAYTELVHALDRLGYMDDLPFIDSANDTRGICATGTLYEFEVLKDNKSVQKLWTASCTRGSFNAKLTLVRELFLDQIPDNYKLLGKIDAS